jgi:small-conductance mechanosensitive channel
MTGLDDWFEALSQSNSLMELGALALCAALAWALAWSLRRALGASVQASITFGKRIVDGVLFPLLLLSLAQVAKALLAGWTALAIFKIAIPLLLALLVIRVAVKVLQAAFGEAPWVRLLERTISWIAWIAMVLWISGFLPLMLEELDQISWKVGGSILSVRTMIEGALTAGAVLLVTLWISAYLEARLLRSATGGQLSLRKAASNALRALLMFVGLMLALSSVGIDLTALSVIGGAVGVGIGFGLQKLAANYVSGFIILTERSIRIGDHVKVDGFEGRIIDISARYTLIAAINGRESIVPNEMMITSRVENLTLNNPRIAQSTVVSVAYDSDVDLVIRLLLDAATSQDRVLPDPEPSVALTAFGADGLEFTLAYWIDFPETGKPALRSAVNLAILQKLRANQIEIPFPQRVIHSRST